MTAEVDRKHQDPDRNKGKRRQEENELDDALEDSFPASDPPAIVQPTPAPEEDDKGGKDKGKARRRSHG